MKQIGRRLTLVLLVLLSFVLVLTGTMMMHFNANAEDAPATVTTEDSEWFKLSYDTNTFDLKLSGDFRDYLDSGVGSVSQLMTAVKNAAMKIVMESILKGNKQPRTVSLASVMLLDASSGDAGDAPPQWDDSFWDDKEKLKEFRDYVVEQLGDPVELQKYYNGEYDMLLDYAVDSYVQQQGGELTSEQKEDLETHLGKVLEKAEEKATEEIKKQAEQDFMNDWVEKNPGKTEEDFRQALETNPQLQADLDKKQNDSAVDFKNNVITPGQAKQEPLADRIERVEEQGVNITATQLFEAFQFVKVDGLNLYDKRIGGEGFTPSTLRYLLGKLPKPSTIADMSKEDMERFFEAHFAVGTTFGDIEFDFTFGFFGNTEAIRKTCRLIAQYVDVIVDGNAVKADVRMPQAFTKALLKLTETGHLTETQKNKIFLLFGKSSREILDKVESYSYEELLEYLKGIDFQYWLNNFLNAEFINTYFGNYFTKAFGRPLAQSDIDRVIDAFSSNAAKLAAKGWDYNDAMDFLRRHVPFFSRIEQFTPAKAEAAANKLLGIVNRIDWNKYKAEYVHEVLSTSTTFNDTVDSYIEQFGELDFYDTFINYMERLFNVLPENIQNGSILDLYDDNGQFSHAGVYSFDFDRLFARVENALRNRGHEGLADRVSEFRTVVAGETSITVDLSLHLSVNDIYQVTYYMGEENMQDARTGLLPVGADLLTFDGADEIGGSNIIGWMNNEIEQGTEADWLTQMPSADVTLYPVTKFTLETLVDHAPGTSLDTFFNNTSHQLSVHAQGVPFAEEYTHQWYYAKNAQAEFVALEDATDDTYEVTHVAQSGVYYVEVVDAKTGVTVESDPIEVTIKPYTVKFGNIQWTQDGENYQDYEDPLTFNNKEYSVKAEAEAPDGFDLPVDLLTFQGTKGMHADEYTLTVSLNAAYTDYALDLKADPTQPGQYVIGTWEIAPLALTFDGINYTHGGTQTYPYTQNTHLIYDGKEYQIIPNWVNLPQGVKIADLVTYTNDKGTKAGDYNMTVALNAKAPNIADYTLSQTEIVTWSIGKLEIAINISGLEGDKDLTYNAETRRVQWKYTPTFPAGMSSLNVDDFVKFAPQGTMSATNAGTYTAELAVTLKPDHADSVFLTFTMGSGVTQQEGTTTFKKDWTIAKLAITPGEFQFRVKGADEWIKYNGPLPYHPAGYEVRVAEFKLSDENIELPDFADLFEITGNEGIKLDTYVYTVAFKNTPEAQNFAVLDQMGGLHDTWSNNWTISEATFEPAAAWNNLEEGEVAYSVNWVKGKNWIGDQDNPVEFSFGAFSLEQHPELAEFYAEVFADIFDVSYEYYLELTSPKLNAVIDPGEYQVKAIITLKAEYADLYLFTDAEFFIDFNVVQVQENVEFAGFSWSGADGLVYDGQGHTLSYTYTGITIGDTMYTGDTLTEEIKTQVAGMFGIVYYSGSSKDESKKLASDALPTNAGYYFAELVLLDSDNYLWTPVAAGRSFLINKATVTVSIQPEAKTSLPFGTYTKDNLITEIGWIIEVKSGNEVFPTTKYSINYAEGFTNVVNGKPTSGDFTAKFEFTLTDANYKWDGVESDTVTIAREWSVQPEQVTTPTEVVIKNSSFTFTALPIVLFANEVQTFDFSKAVKISDSAEGKNAFEIVGFEYDRTATQVNRTYPLTIRLQLKDAYKNTYVLKAGTTKSDADGILSYVYADAWKIVENTPADKTMVEIEFRLSQENFTADGTEKSVQLVWSTKPAEAKQYISFTVSGDQKATDPGSYKLVATFTLSEEGAKTYAIKGGSSADNFTVLVSGELCWSINGTVTGNNYPAGYKFDYNNGEVEVTLTEGTLSKEYTSSITEKLLDDYLDDIRAQEAFKNQKFVGGKAYDIHFEKNGQEESVNGKFHVRLLIPEDIRSCDHIYVIHITDSGEIEIVDGATQNGDYMEFDVNGFSIYAVVGFNDQKTDWILIGGLALIAILLLVTLIIICVFTAKLKKPEEAIAEEPVAEEVQEEAEEELLEEEVLAEETPEALTPEEAHTPYPLEEGQQAVVVETAGEEEPVEAPAPKMVTILDKSFTARLTLAENDTKAYYNELKNYILSYKYVRSRISWSYDTFNKGRNKICRLQLMGKSLYLYAPLDPKSLEPKYHHKDVSGVARYADYPTKLKVRSARSLKYAKALVDMVMGNFALERDEAYVAEDFTFTYKTQEELIAAGEIRKREITAPAFFDMDAPDVIENSPALPDVELGELPDVELPDLSQVKLPEEEETKEELPQEEQTQSEDGE